MFDPNANTANSYLFNPNYTPNSYSQGFGRQGNAMGRTPAGGSPLGWNTDTLQLGLSGVSALGNFWNAFQAQKLAKQQFNFTKDITETNLANQIKSYNTTLGDRARSRGFVEGQSQSEIDDYIRNNSASR